MGTAERKKREKERRRLEIIEAAEEVFFARGFDEPTVDDIASAAELSKGTIYLYFKSREEILSEIVYRAHQKLVELFREASAGKSTGLEKVGAIGQAYTSFSTKYKGYFGALFAFEGKHKDAECEEDMPLWFVIEALKEGMKDGSIRPDIDPVKTGLALWAHSHGIIILTHKFFEDFESCFQVSPDELIRYNFEETVKYLKGC